MIQSQHKSKQHLSDSSIANITIGNRGPIHCREETVRCSKLSSSFKILFISDTHYSCFTHASNCQQLVELAYQTSPDCILFGGDLIDTRKGLLCLEDVFNKLMPLAPVGFVLGNHDRLFSKHLFQHLSAKSGAIFLEEHPLLLPKYNCSIIGTLKQALSPSHCHILCTHHPRTFKKSKHLPLTLAGHYHGGQFVFFSFRNRLYPAAMLYPYNGLRFEEDGATLIVSRGLNDTIPIRYNCPQEVVLCKLEPQGDW